MISDAKVMIVEDDAFTRGLLRQILLRLPVGQLIEAASADAALRLLATTQVDVVVCDIVMEPVDGITFLRRLRAGGGIDGVDRPLDPKTPVLMLSAHSHETHVTAARDAGATGFLTKPIVPATLEKRLRHCLAGAAAPARKA